MSEAVITQMEGRVTHLMLNRPDHMNAITIDLAEQLAGAVSDLEDGSDVIVIRGAGGNFSVGGDFKQVEHLRAAGSRGLGALFEAFARACDAIAAVDVPVLAAVEGYALAGGFELMQACDVAIVRDDAQIGDHHASAGVIPAGGGSQRLPRLVGRQRALGLILSGERISGADAVAWGLAFRSLPAADFNRGVDELANRLAGRSREAQAAIKRLVRDGLELPLVEALARERDTAIEFLAAEREVEWQRN